MMRRLGILLLTVSAFALPVLLAELALRLSGHADYVPVMFVPDPWTVWRLKPNANERVVRSGYFDYRWTSSAQQFRGGHEYPSSAPPDRLRILSVGDSFTFGVGVNDPDTYPARLEEFLARRCAHDLEVINAGVGGFGTSHALALFEHYGNRLEPDLVILGLLTSDRIDDARADLYEVRGDTVVPVAGASDRFWGRVRLTELWVYQGLVQHSAFANWLQQRVAAAQAALTAPQRFEAPADSSEVTHGSAPQDVDWLLTQKLLRRMRDTIHSAGARLLVVVIPFGSELESRVNRDGKETAAIERMMVVCGELGIPCVDFSTWFAESYPRDAARDLYIEGEGHMTALGYARLAESVADRITKTDMVPCRALAADESGADR